MENAKNYSYRVNICPPIEEVEEKGEGDFYFLEDKDLKEMCPWNTFKCIPQHYSTVAYELIPEFLKRKTGEEWHVSSANNGQLLGENTTTCLYSNQHGRAAYLELFKGEEIMYNWDEEDRIPPSHSYNVIIPGKEVIKTNSPELVAKSIVDAIIHNVKYRNYIAEK